MAVKLATAFVQILPSTRGFGSALRNALQREGQAPGRQVGQNVAGGLVGALRSGLKVVPALLGGALIVKGVSKAFGFAKGAVFDFNSQLQQATIAFTSMLGSGQKARTFLDQLQAFAKATPFEFGDLVSSSQTLLGMGVAAKDVIPDLTALGDSVASVGGGADVLNNTILAFGQTMAKGTLDMGNMNQLLQGGIPSALKVLAASYHVTTGEMVKMISTGKVQSADALPRLVKGLEKGTKSTAALGGMMDKQSRTFSGALSNIQDSLTQSVGKAFRPFFDAASKGLQTVAGWLDSPAYDRFAATASRVFLAAGAFILRLKPIAVEVFQRYVVPAIHAAVGVFGNLVAAGRNVWAVIAPLAQAVGRQLAVAFGVLLVVASKVGVVLGVVGRWVSGHATLVRSLVVAVGAGVAVWGAWRIAVSAWALVTRIATGVQAAFNVVMNANPIMLVVIAVAALAAGLVYAYKHSESFRRVVQTAFRAVATAGRAVWSVLRGVFNGIRSAIGVVVRVVVTAVRAWVGVWRVEFNVVRAIVTGVFRVVRAVIVGAVRGVAAVIRSVLGGIRAVWSGTWNGIRSVVAGVWGGIRSIVSGAINAVKGVIDRVGGTIAGAWSKLWDGLKTTVTNVVSGIASIVSGIWDGVTSGLKSVVNGGIDIINGAIRGINHMIDIANKVPFVDIPHVSPIPHLARGGMTLGPTFALIGDNPSGQEVVLPTDSPRTISALSAALSKASGGAGGGRPQRVAGGRLELGRDSSGRLEAWVRDLILDDAAHVATVGRMGGGR